MAAFTQGLLFTLFLVIVISVIGVDGKRRIPKIPEYIPHDFPEDVPIEFPNEFPDGVPNENPGEIPSEIPSENPSKIPVEVQPLPEEEVAIKNSGTPSKGCSMNICFALDGSDSISSSEYQRQRFLARRIAEGLPTGEEFGLAAIQYSVSNTAISPLTFDRDDFVERIRSSRQDGGASGTFLVAGINYCFGELVEPNMTEPLCGINKIIVMGDGIGNIGGSPVERAREFEGQGGQICTVGFGRPDIGVLASIAGSVSRVFTANRSIRVLADEILESILGRR